MSEGVDSDLWNEVFQDACEQNFPPLDLDQYKDNRNKEFYEIQEEWIKNRDQASWEKMYSIIYDVCLSTCKQKAVGIRIPDLEGKALEACCNVLQKYKEDEWFRCKSLESVVHWAAIPPLLNKNLQLEERTYSYEEILEKRLEQEEQYDFLNDDEEY